MEEIVRCSEHGGPDGYIHYTACGNCYSEANKKIATLEGNLRMADKVARSVNRLIIEHCPHSPFDLRASIRGTHWTDISELLSEYNKARDKWLGGK